MVSMICVLVIAPLMFLMLIILGIKMMYEGNLLEEKLATSMGWSTVPGKVIRTAIDETRIVRGGGPSARSVRVYVPKVTYIYQVNGHRYEGQQIKLGQEDYYPKDEAYEILDRYPVGSSLDIYYNDQDPAEAVLITEISQRSYRKSRSGVIGLIIGIIYVIGWIALVSAYLNGDVVFK